MKQKILITGVIAVLLLISIVYFYPQIKPSHNLTDIKDVVITLERGPCYGACPVYKLTVSGDGTVIYKGERFVRINDTRMITVSEEEVRQLISEFERINYFSLEDSYEEKMVTDMETVITSITVNGKTKIVRHYHGDKSTPKELRELENKIDEIVNSEQWVKRE